MSDTNGTKTKITKTKDTITLSIDENILDAIRKDADDRGLSINSKINSILAKYAYFGMYIESQYPCVITSRNFQFILENLDENNLAKIFRTIIVHLLTPKLFERNVSLTLDDWITYVCEGTLLNSGMIQKFSYHNDEEDRLYMVFTHKHGIKWSTVLGNILIQLLSNLLNYHAVITVLLPPSVTLRVLEKNPLGSSSNSRRVENV